MSSTLEAQVPNLGAELTVKALIQSMKQISFMDEFDRPSTVEILLKYSELIKESDTSKMIIAFSKDVRKILEAGQRAGNYSKSHLGAKQAKAGKFDIRRQSIIIGCCQIRASYWSQR